MEAERLVSGVQRGEPRAVARAITLVENDAPEAVPLLSALHGGTERAYRIGLTGPPGAGKSTLVERLATHLRGVGKRLGIIAVDPTSPFTGGALLGDRVRMDRLTTDPGVFIRSMASRGSLGGLCRRATEAADVLAASGVDIVLFETVGVGQSEVEIAETADTTVVVFSPESGDGVQTMKAGLMEIADIFCVNKSDRDGAERLVRELEATLEIAAGSPASAPGRWRPPVLQTVALRAEGVAALADAIAAHEAHLRGTGALAERRRRRVQARLSRMLSERMARRLAACPGHAEALEAFAAAVQRGETTPYAAVEALFAAFQEALGASSS